MRRTLTLTTAMLAVGLTAAQAQSVNTDAMVQSLTAQGFSNIELKREDGQLEVEGWRGEEKLEITYDLATGDVVKQESERVPGGKAADDRNDRDDGQGDDNGGDRDDTDSDDGPGDDNGGDRDDTDSDDGPGDDNGGDRDDSDSDDGPGDDNGGDRDDNDSGDDSGDDSDDDRD